MRFHKIKPERLRILRINLNDPEYIENAVYAIGLRTAYSTDTDLPERKMRKGLRRIIK